MKTAEIHYSINGNEYEGVLYVQFEKEIKYNDKEQEVIVDGVKMKMTDAIDFVIENGEMKTAQDNKCAICGNLFYKTPDVDHDHKTNKVRQLLCNHCNGGLGNFYDNAELLRKAANYIDKWEKQ
jgi:hypothetical protein